MPVSFATINTRLAVQDVADTLLAEGKRPSVNAVRTRLGRGSDTTIASALNDWWTNIGQRLAELQSRPDIPDAVFKAADGLWAAALDKARDTLTADREALQVEREKHRDQVRCAEDQRDEARKMAAKLKQELAKTHQDLREADNALTAKTTRIEALATRSEDLETQLGDAHKRLSEQAQQHEHRRAQDAERFDRAERRLVAQLKNMKAEYTQAETRLTDEAKRARAAEQKARDALNAAHMENNQLHQDVEKATTLLRHRERDWKELRDQLEMRRNELGTIKTQLDFTQQERDHHMKRNVTLLETIDADQRQIQQLRERIVEFETRMKMQRKKKFQRAHAKTRRRRI